MFVFMDSISAFEVLSCVSIAVFIYYLVGGRNSIGFSGSSIGRLLVPISDLN